MKSQLHLLVSLFIILCASCTDDDSLPNNDLAGQNGFQFANQVFLVNQVYISNDNAVILANSSIDAESVVNNVDIARFETDDASPLSTQSYFVGEELLSCFTATDAVWDKGAINEGEIILQEANVASGFFRIVEINESIQTVRLIFEFERTDGQLVAGSYEGNYQTTNF